MFQNMIRGLKILAYILAGLWILLCVVVSIAVPRSVDMGLLEIVIRTSAVIPILLLIVIIIKQ